MLSNTEVIYGCHCFSVFVICGRRESGEITGFYSTLWCFVMSGFLAFLFVCIIVVLHTLSCLVVIIFMSLCILYFMQIQN